MGELAEGKNIIGRMAAVLKKPYKATFNLFFFSDKGQMHGLVLVIVVHLLKLS